MSREVHSNTRSLAQAPSLSPNPNSTAGRAAVSAPLVASAHTREAQNETEVKGRWTVHTCKDCGGHAHCYDRCPADRRRVWTEVVPIPVVPCDDAAIERAALALHLARGLSRGSFAMDGYCECREQAMVVLRAAGETPDA
jgi:hypothetical protein